MRRHQASALTKVDAQGASSLASQLDVDVVPHHAASAAAADGDTAAAAATTLVETAVAAAAAGASAGTAADVAAAPTARCAPRPRSCTTAACGMNYRCCRCRYAAAAAAAATTAAAATAAAAAAAAVAASAQQREPCHLAHVVHVARCLCGVTETNAFPRVTVRVDLSTILNQSRGDCLPILIHCQIHHNTM
jgi:hypothetical protein